MDDREGVLQPGVGRLLFGLGVELQLLGQGNGVTRLFLPSVVGPAAQVDGQEQRREHDQDHQRQGGAGMGSNPQADGEE